MKFNKNDIEQFLTETITVETGAGEEILDQRDKELVLTILAENENPLKAAVALLNLGAITGYQNAKENGDTIEEPEKRLQGKIEQEQDLTSYVKNHDFLSDLRIRNKFETLLNNEIFSENTASNQLIQLNAGFRDLILAAANGLDKYDIQRELLGIAKDLAIDAAIIGYKAGIESAVDRIKLF